MFFLLNIFYFFFSLASKIFLNFGILTVPKCIPLEMTRYKIFFLFVLLSSNLIAQPDHWETAVFNTDVWAYFLGNSEPDADWNTFEYDDASWLRAPGGIGYGDDDDTTIIDPVTSLYIRHKFEIINKEAIEALILHADYDDAFVAYLNGVEIFRANINGKPPAFDAWANVAHEASLVFGNVPEAFQLNAASINDLLKEGDNLLSIQIHNFEGLASSDLSSNFYLSLGINDNSTKYRPTPFWFVAPPLPIDDFNTPIPIIKVYTSGQEIGADEEIIASMGIIWNGNGNLNSTEDAFNEYEGSIAIKRRGQSSLIFPKNGFAIEMKDEFGEDMDTSFLDFPREEDWVLHGPYSDKTLMRNVLAMHLANTVDGYHSRTRYVELFINDNYEGIYVLMEKIKRDKNRVDIANLNPEDIEGDELTGGYIFKIDKDQPDWFSNYNMLLESNPLAFQYVYPKASKIETPQRDYIKSYVDSFERALNAPSLMFDGKRYDDFADVASFIDHMIIKELAKDIDAYRISSYYYKKKDSNGGKIYAGPVWDFNLGFANADYCDGAAEWGWQFESPTCGQTNPFWFKKMYNDLNFRNQLKCRWASLREGPLALDAIYNFIDEKAALIQPAVARNFQRWSVLGEYVWPNSAVFQTHEEEVEYMKMYISRRIEWMDQSLGTCITSNKEIKSDAINLFPNPFQNKLFCALELEDLKPIHVSIYNSIGQKVFTEKIEPSHKGNFRLSFDLPTLPNGIYLFEAICGKQKFLKKISCF